MKKNKMKTITNFISEKLQKINSKTASKLTEEIYTWDKFIKFACDKCGFNYLSIKDIEKHLKDEDMKTSDYDLLYIDVNSGFGLNKEDNIFAQHCIDFYDDVYAKYKNNYSSDCIHNIFTDKASSVFIYLFGSRRIVKNDSLILCVEFKDIVNSKNKAIVILDYQHEQLYAFKMIHK